MTSLMRIRHICLLLSMLICSFTIGEALDTKTHVLNVIRKDYELSEFVELLSDSQVFSFYVGMEKTGTIFAPTNDAIMRFRQRNPEIDLASSGNLMTYFVALTLIDESDLPAIATPTRRGNARYYLKKATESNEDWHFYVDEVLAFRKHRYHNAQIRWNIFVIDDIPQCVATAFEDVPVADQLTKEQRNSQKLSHLDTHFFNAALAKHNMHHLFQQNVPSTFFIVEGKYSSPAKYNPKVTSEILRGHVIPEQVLFTPGFSNLTYKTEQYTDNLRISIALHNETDSTGNSTLYVRSRIVSAQSRPKGVVMSRITTANVGVQNGVVHFIDRPIGAIVDTIYEYIFNEKDGRFRDFFRLIDQSKDFVQFLKSRSGHKTIFIPTNEAMSVIPSDSWEHIKANSTHLFKVLQHHVILGHQIVQEDVRQSPDHMAIREASSGETIILREVQCKKKTCTFALVPKFIVESSGINATVQSPDIAATDGVIHVIDRVLGVASHDLWDKVKKDANLETTVRVAQKNQWYHKFLENVSKRYTFFAPSEQAWSNLRMAYPTEYKQLVDMDEFFLQGERILNRHVLPYELTFQELGKSEIVTGVNENDKIYIKYVNGKTLLQWNGVTAEITQGDLQGTNGIIHVIDNVLMDRSDMYSGASTTSISISVISSLMICLYLTRL